MNGIVKHKLAKRLWAWWVQYQNNNKKTWNIQTDDILDHVHNKLNTITMIIFSGFCGMCDNCLQTQQVQKCHKFTLITGKYVLTAAVIYSAELRLIQFWSKVDWPFLFGICSVQNIKCFGMCDKFFNFLNGQCVFRIYCTFELYPGKDWDCSNIQGVCRLSVKLCNETNR